MAACHREPRESFRLESFLQADARNLPLNAALVWLFSEPVDPASVQAGTIRVEEELGEGRVLPPATGRFEVIPGGRVVFTPTLPSRADLSDGGLRPGRSYRVTVDGFPRSSGLRSTLGRVLESRAVHRFTTAADPRAWFTDRSPGRGPFLKPDAEVHRVASGFGQVAAIVLDPSGKLVLLADEPLRPDSVVPEAFTLTQVDSVGVERRIPLDVRLQNREPDPWALSLLPSGYDAEPIGARIDLELKSPLDADALASLRIDESVTDLGGNALQGPFAGSFYLVSDSSGPASPSIVEDFLRQKEWESRDGTDRRVASATWAGDGTLTAHLPRAAALGSSGNFILRGSAGTIQRRCVTLEVRSGETASVASGSILTAQVQVAVLGSLTVAKGSTPAFPGSLEEAIPPGFDLVLVAGGDLVIEGNLECSGSVLLAAGGAVRIGRGARVSATGLRVVSPAAPELNGELPAVREVVRSPLPDANVGALGEPIVYRATSPWIRTPLPSAKFGAVQWTGDHGSGRVRFSFRSARALAGSAAEVDPATISPWIESPEHLPSADRIQFRIDLEIPASPKEREIRRPFVDRLTIPARRS